MLEPKTLVDDVVQYYVESGDFNGLPAYHVIAKHSIPSKALRTLLGPLVERGQISLNFGDRHPNPHIRALPDPPIADQLDKLKSAVDDHYVLYPTSAVLKDRVVPGKYEGRPFSLRLALGEPQLSYASFDLSVIDQYRRDPRYRFWTNDVQATLSIGDDAYESPKFPEKHKVLIQSFGFSYSEDLRRAAAVFLRDLDRLTPEHQQIWAAQELEGDYKLHPDFYRAAIMGDWELKSSLRDALAEEIRVINRMCRDIDWKPLFRQEFDEPPPHVALLIRPTAAEFNEFVLELDKMLSDNINTNFFPAAISREIEELRKDGKVAVRQRGTLAMLEEWFRTKFRTPDPKPLNETLATLRKVRKLRQKPAHDLKADLYDESLFDQQRELFKEAYNAVRTIRLMLQNHPKAKKALGEMDERVRIGDIWSY